MSAPAPVLIPRSRLPFAPLTADVVRLREESRAMVLAGFLAEGRADLAEWCVAEYVDLRHRSDLECGYARRYPDGVER